MSAPEDRLRARPSERFAGAEHTLDLPAALRALRAEPSTGTGGHRQIALAHRGPVRLVLYAFEAGGRLPEHRAPGWVTVHVLRGTLRVRTPEAHYTLSEGQLLQLAPDVPHDVDAPEAADMLLGVYPEGPVNAATQPPARDAD
jgi:quercetin dioxygenase-like cupin family protein